MATSPNYAWAEPDNSSLVKNGAADIRTLGDAIDTSVWNVGFGQAGKNKIINGNFSIWQRGTSFSFGATTTFTADRFAGYGFSGTQTVSRQTFTPGAAPVAGYEGAYFLRTSCTNTQNLIEQKIEDVQTFAGQTMTVSFWAKSASATTVTVAGEQNFGSGGSASVNLTSGTASVTTSWARYSVTFTVPSISGKTIGTSSYLRFSFASTTLSNNLDFWGIQAEYGSTATPFQTATGTIQGELAACQRYYYKAVDTSSSFGTVGFGMASSTTASAIWTQFPVSMRVKPTSVDFSTLILSDSVGTITVTALTIDSNVTSISTGATSVSGTGQTQYRPMYLRQNSSTAGYIAFNAEL